MTLGTVLLTWLTAASEQDRFTHINAVNKLNAE